MGVSGADVDALDRVGVQLEKASGGLRRKGRGLASALDAAPWKGQKAERFRRDFHSVHLRSIEGAARFLDDAYETLRRNSDEQRRASGLGERGLVNELVIWIRRHFGPPEMPRWDGQKGRPFLRWPLGRPSWLRMPHLEGWSSPRLPHFRIPKWAVPMPAWPWIGGLWIGFALIKVLGGSAQAPANPNASTPPKASPAPPTKPAPAPAPAPGADPSKAWGRQIDDATAKRIADTYITDTEKVWFDHNAVNGTNSVGGDWYQCVAWARARWREAGVPWPSSWRGDGGVLASKINHALGRADSNVPTVGAIVSFPGSNHVAVVEAVEGNRFRISEMNWGGNGWKLALPEEYGERWVNVGPGQIFAPLP